MLKRQRGETVKTLEWDGDKAEATVWKRTECGDVSVEITSPEAIAPEHVEVALKLARKVATELFDE